MSKACVIVYMNLGPYHIARLRAMVEIVPETHAIEVAAEQDLYPWRARRDCLGFPVTTLFTDRACEAVPMRVQCGAVRAALTQIDPGVVIVVGYTEPVMRAATDWACRRGVPVIMQTDSTYRDRPRRWWKEFVKRRLIRRFSAVAVAGQRSEEYARLLGAGTGTVSTALAAIDNAHFEAGADAARANAASERTRLSLPDRYFLTVARFSPEKNLVGLLGAFSAYRRCGGTWDLVLVGSGPQENELKDRVRTDALAGVHFVTWRSYDELPYYYALASCFVLPSLSEPWGLVVNEAMACGLAVLVSEACGCVPELCKPGENGYCFAPNATDQLTELMLQMSVHGEQLSAFGQASRRIISSFTPQTWAAGLKSCVTAAAERETVDAAP